jgi:hypothetical protein
MDSLGYWLFLLIIYMLSAMMKKRQQKAARQQLEQGEENSWEAPNFVKELFTDFVGDDDEEPEEIVVSDLEKELEAELNEPVFQDSPLESVEERPLKERHLSKSNLSIIDEKHEIGTLTHRKQKRKISQSRFFQHQGDVRLAMIYKEIMDKPRSLRKSIR